MAVSLVYSSLLFLQLRGSPAELPYRPPWLAPLVLADLALTTLLYWLLDVERGAELALLQAVLHLLLFAAVLWLRSRSARWVQTMTALFCMSVLFNLLLLPPILVFAAFGLETGFGARDGVAAGAAAGFLQLINLCLLLWRLLAEGQVLRHALDLPQVASTLIVVVVFIVESFALGQFLERS